MSKIFLAILLSIFLTACAVGSGDTAGEPEAAPVETAGTVKPAPASQPAPEPEPELDYALYISDQPILTVEGCLVTDPIPVHFINNTGEDGYVLDIPRLERLNADGIWTAVPYKEGIGFCGTPSTLPAAGREWSESISTLWGPLEDGRYRLSYAAGPTFDTEETASGEFTLYTPENNAGLPLAGQD